MVTHRARPLTDFRAVAITADGRRFVTGADDGSVRLWGTEPFRRLDSASAHAGGTLAVAWEESSGYVFSAGADNRVERRTFTDDRLSPATYLDELRGYGPIRDLATTSAQLASVDEDGMLRVCDHDGTSVTTGVAGFELHTVTFLASGDRLVVGGARDHQGVAQLWQLGDAGSLTIQAEVEVPRCRTVRCALAVHDDLVVLGGDGGVIVSWNVATQSLDSFRSGTQDVVHALSFRAPRTLLSSGSDGTTRNWNISDQRMVTEFPRTVDSGVLAMASSTTAKPPIMIVAGGSGVLRLYKDEKPIEHQFTGHTSAVRAIAVSDRDLVVTGSVDRTIRVWNHNGGLVAVLEGHEGTVSAVATWPGNNAWIISGSEDGKVIVWDRHTRAAVKNPIHHGAMVWAVAVSPDGKRIFAGGNDGKVSVWNANTFKRIGRPWEISTKAVSAIAVSGNGEVAVVGDDKGYVWFRALHANAPSGPSAMAVEGGQVRSVAIDHLGLTAVAGASNGEITVWDVRTGEQKIVPITTGHADVRTVLLTPSGDCIISCGADGSVERWDSATGDPLSKAHLDFVDAVETIGLMPDGELIVAGGSEGELELVRTSDRSGEDPGTDSESAVPGGRRPHPFLASDTPTALDTLDTNAEMRAVAELIAARHTHAPISLALLGNWGSGKSSLILQIKNHVHLLATSVRPEQRKTFWVSRIRQVRFNAWHYSDDNLWTGLFEELLRTLSQDPAKDPDLRGAKPYTENDSSRGKQSREHREELVKLHKEMSENLDAAKSAEMGLLGPLSLRRSWYLFRAMRKVVNYRAEPNGQKLSVLFESTKTKLALNRWIALGVLALIAILTASIVLVPLNLPNMYAWTRGAAAWLVGIGGVVTTGWVWLGKRNKELAEKLKEEASLMEKEIAAETEQLKKTDPVFRRNELVAELFKPDRYARFRGITGFVHQDLQVLAEAIELANSTKEPDGRPFVERIVLYIDDLDRCAPAKVTEVLQAVNLLMSFPMFVVVVAVDPPSLLQALRSARQDTASITPPDDQHIFELGLLDKVFNVVFALEPLGDRGRAYLQRLVRDIEPDAPAPTEPTVHIPAPSTGAPAPAAPIDHPAHAAQLSGRVRAIPTPALGSPPGKHLRISEPELHLLTSLTTILPGPRAVKKLTNIYRLILVSEFARRENFVRGDYQAAAIVAAGLIRSPRQFAAMIEHLKSVPLCDDGDHPHCDVVQVLRNCDKSCDELARTLATQIEELTGDRSRCAVTYRDWSLKIARYGFETYHHYISA